MFTLLSCEFLRRGDLVKVSNGPLTCPFPTFLRHPRNVTCPVSQDWIAVCFTSRISMYILFLHIEKYSLFAVHVMFFFSNIYIIYCIQISAIVFAARPY